ACELLRYQTGRFYEVCRSGAHDRHVLIFSGHTAPSRTMNARPDPIPILLVEDNPTDVLLLEETFADIPHVDCELVHVERLTDGLACLRTRAFDVVLLDLGLPDSTGVETFLRLHREAPGVPVLVLTALDD